jgi:MOSC domain-containing protein YiiM
MDPDHPKSTFFVEKKRYVTDLSYGLKQAQSAALQKHHGGQILSVYWEQRQDYTIWVLVASSAPLTP